MAYLSKETLNDNRFKLFSIGPNSEGWGEIQRQYPILSDWGKEILRAGLEGKVKSILVEEDYFCKDHRNLFSNFYSKKFRANSAATHRLHFFSENIDSIDRFFFDAESLTSSYLGYSILRDVKERCIGRTVIDPHKIGIGMSDDAFVLRTPFQTHIAGGHFHISGYPYISQDADSTVCAHSALWGVCRYLSERYEKYAEVYPYDLIKMTGDARGRVVPHRGMDYQDYSTILTKFGCYPIIRATKHHVTDPTIAPAAFRELYCYVESGFPVLASFPGHVISLIGHTMDYSRNVTPNNENIIDSSQYLKQFLACDDNRFPYRRLGFTGDPQNYSKYSIDDIKTFVCPLPEKVYLNSDMARQNCEKALTKDEAFLAKIQPKPWITRLFITSSTAFQRRKLYYSKKNERKDKLNNKIGAISLPHFVWVMEITTPALGKQGKAFAEIVLDASAGKKENAFLFMRAGNTFALDAKRVSIEDNPVAFDQYTHNLGERQ